MRLFYTNTLMNTLPTSPPGPPRLDKKFVNSLLMIRHLPLIPFLHWNISKFGFSTAAYSKKSSC